MKHYWIGALTLAGAVLSSAVTLASDTLPLTRVRLYQTGVAYFERTGTVSPTSVGLPVPAGHLDDALKTLVVLNADGASEVSQIDFGSSVSHTLGRALAGLPGNPEAALDFTTLLSSLEGAPVEIRVGPEVVRGRLVDVLGEAESDLERCAPGAEDDEHEDVCATQRLGSIVVLTDRAEIRRFAIDDVTHIRPLDGAQTARLRSALDAVSGQGTRASRELSVVARGGRSITLGYVAEAPVWRSTYRLVLGDDDQAALQGWALIHNDTDENWQHVALELVNGRPDSFLLPLAAPRYARRELVTPEPSLSTVPQLLDTTADEMWETGDVGGAGLSGIGGGGGGSGQGFGLGSIGTLGHGSGSSASSLLSVGSLASLAPSRGVESGAMFRYTTNQSLDLRARGSALVPFLTTQVKVRRIAWFASPGEDARSALYLTNDTDQTLPAGTLAVFSDGGFAGETLLGRTKPSEERILPYGSDLDVELTTEQHTFTDRPHLLTYNGGPIVEHYVRAHATRYRIQNRSSTARSVYLDLDYVDNSRVTSGQHVAYDAERGQALALFEVPAHSSITPLLKVEEGLVRTHEPDDISLAWLLRMSREKSLSTAQRSLLSQAVAHKRAVERLEAQLIETRGRLGIIHADLERHRGDLQAASGRREKRLVRRLDETEQQLYPLREREDEIVRASKRANNQLQATLKRLDGT